MMTQVLVVCAFLVVVVVCSAEQRRLSNEICASVMATAEQLNGAEKTFTFRCRAGDDCGGIGDRLGGVMGGAFFAMLSGRSFRIWWPGWDHVFKPGRSNWTYDGPALGIPYLDEHGEQYDKVRVTGVEGNQIYPAFTTRKDVGVVNDLNSRQITNSTLRPVIDQYKHVYFHSNRGPNAQMFLDVSRKYNWAKKSEDVEDNYAEAYRCVFEGLFRPTDEFLRSDYKGINQNTVPFAHIVRIVEDPSFTSMAFHHRVDDSTAESKSDRETINDQDIRLIISLAEKHRVEGKKMNLFFITNSNSSAHKVLRTEAIHKTFHQVYSQDLTATIHVNADRTPRAGEQVSQASVLSTLQAMRDWWVMRLADILISPNSGFSKSAALLAPREQIRYEDSGRAQRTNYWVMCGNRFC